MFKDPYPMVQSRSCLQKFHSLSNHISQCRILTKARDTEFTKHTLSFCVGVSGTDLNWLRYPYLLMWLSSKMNTVNSTDNLCRFIDLSLAIIMFIFYSTTTQQKSSQLARGWPELCVQAPALFSSSDAEYGVHPCERTSCTVLCLQLSDVWPG